MHPGNIFPQMENKCLLWLNGLENLKAVSEGVKPNDGGLDKGIDLLWWHLE